MNDIILEGIPDDTLYHYTNSIGLESIPTTKQLLFSHHNDMKDKTELEQGHKILLQAVKSHFNINEDNMFFKALLESLIKHMYIFCVCKRKDNAHLWKHYADGGRGGVIAFSASALYKRFVLEVPVMNWVPADYMPENYEDLCKSKIATLQYPAFNVIHPINLRTDTHAILYKRIPGYEHAVKTISDLYTSIVALKESKYREEEEIRWFHLPPQPKSFHSELPYFKKLNKRRAMLDLSTLENMGIKEILITPKCKTDSKILDRLGIPVRKIEIQ